MDFFFSNKKEAKQQKSEHKACNKDMYFIKLWFQLYSINIHIYFYVCMLYIWTCIYAFLFMM